MAEDLEVALMTGKIDIHNYGPLRTPFQSNTTRKNIIHTVRISIPASSVDFKDFQDRSNVKFCLVMKTVVFKIGS